MSQLNGSIRRKLKTVKFDCNTDKVYCHPEELSFINELDWPQDHRYIFVVRILNSAELRKLPISDFIVAFLYMNKTYSYFYIVARYVILLISLVSFLAYHSKISKLQKSYISSEQTQLWWLGILLFLVNDPLFLFTFTHRSILFSGLAILTLLTFTALLFYFWLATSDKLVNNGKAQSRVLNLTLAILLYLTALGTYGNLTLYSVNHPLSHFGNYLNENFGLMKTAFYGVLSITLAVLFFRYCRIYSKGNDATSRESVFFLYTSFFTVVYSCFLFSGTIEIYHDNKVRQILLYGLVNLYLLFMHYSYSPIGDGGIELVKLQGADTSRMEESRPVGKVEIEGEDEEEGEDGGEEDDD